MSKCHPSILLRFIFSRFVQLWNILGFYAPLFYHPFWFFFFLSGLPLHVFIYVVHWFSQIQFDWTLNCLKKCWVEYVGLYTIHSILLFCCLSPSDRGLKLPTHVILFDWKGKQKVIMMQKDCNFSMFFCNNNWPMYYNNNWVYIIKQLYTLRPILEPM